MSLSRTIRCPNLRITDDEIDAEYMHTRERAFVCVEDPSVVIDDGLARPSNIVSVHSPPQNVHKMQTVLLITKR